MPKLSNFSIWGKHFVLQSRLDFSHRYGYIVDNCQRFRIPVKNSAAFVRKAQNADDHSLNLVLNKELNSNDFLPGSFVTGQIDQSLVDAIGKELQKNIVVVEASFEKLKNLPDLAIIPNNEEEELKHLQLLSDSWNELFVQVNSDTDLLVITGEMFWSGWLTKAFVAKIIEDVIVDDTDIILDTNGVWQLLLTAGNSNSEVFRFGHSELAADLSVLVNPQLIKKNKQELYLLENESGKRELILRKEKASVFHLGESEYLRTNGEKLASHIYIKHFSPPSFEAKSRKLTNMINWLTPFNFLDGKMAEQLLINPPELNYTKKLVEMNGRYVLDINKGAEFKQGDILGKKVLSQNIYIDVRKLVDIEKKLLCIHGQYVQKSTPLVENTKLGGFKKEMLAAPAKGKVNLSELEDGYIIIERRSSSDNFQIPFSGKYLRNRQKNIPQFEVQGIEIILAKQWGQAVAGYLIGLEELMRSSSEQVRESIAFVNSLADVMQFDLNELVVRGAVAVVVKQAEEAEIKAFTFSQTFSKNLLSLAVLDEVVTNKTSRIDKLLKQHRGHYIFIEKASLLIPQAKQGLSMALELVEEQELFPKPRKGMQVKIIGYYPSQPYARIEKLDDNLVTLSDSSKLYDSKLINLIAY